MKLLTLAQAVAMAAIVTAVSTNPALAQGLGGAVVEENEPAPKTAPTSDKSPEAVPKQEPEPAQPNVEPQAKKIDKSRLPPVSTYQAMLDANKKTGWIAFRNYGGKQFIYFSALQTLHCRLKEIRYSINSKALDQRFGLVKCNPYLPFSLPENSPVSDIVITVPGGSAKTVAVQVVWEDDRESEVVVFGPCPGVGGRSCATIAE